MTIPETGAWEGPGVLLTLGLLSLCSFGISLLNSQLLGIPGGLTGLALLGLVCTGYSLAGEAR